ncbi:hypothetical protein N7470_002670 [Penicillium chermesinum]|nr:hypothetical protein N7470_002670 [Penicillium chermesinum]
MQTTPEEANGEAQPHPPGTPPRPPYSPVTPVFAKLEPLPAGRRRSYLHPYRQNPVAPIPQTFHPTVPRHLQPTPQSSNPSRHQFLSRKMQKQQSLRDINTLERLKEAAGANPEAFARDLADGRLRTEEDHGTVIQFSDNRAMDAGEDADDNEKADGTSSFGRIPKPQNIVRMPPINWAKYQIVGEPLDRMHEEQLHRPSPGAPRREPAPEHVLASPYRPLVDRIETPTRLARPSKSKK